VIRHVGEEDLRDDHRAHAEAEQDTEREHVPDGCHSVPVIVLPLDELALGEGLDIGRQQSLETIAQLDGVDARERANQAQLDRSGRAAREDLQETPVAGDHRAIHAERGAELEDADHSKAMVVELAFHGLALGEPLHHRAVFRARGAVEQDRVGPAQQVELGENPRDVHAGLARVEGHHEDVSRRCVVPGIPEWEAGVDRAHRRNPGDTKGLVQAPTREAAHHHQIAGLRVDQHDVSAQALVKAHRAGVQRVLESELHEHQDHGEGHPGQGHEEAQSLPAELLPGEAKSAEHPQIEGSAYSAIRTSTSRSVS
jgi:hypothetical protein